MVKGQLHGIHSGGGSPFSKNSCVRRECPIRHLLKTDWSLRVLRWWVHGSLTMGAISWSLFSGDSSHVLCHMAVMCLRMTGWKSEGGMRQGCMSVLRAALAALSARSLPRMPTWPGSQQRWMSKPDALSDISLMISSIMGWSVLRWSSACRHDMKSLWRLKTFSYWSVRCTRERAVWHELRPWKWNCDLVCDDRNCMTF